MTTLAEAQREVDAVCELMHVELTWIVANNRADQIQALATQGHEPSKKLILQFKFWYVHLRFRSRTFVEESNLMIAAIQDYRAAGYLQELKG